MDGRGRAFDNIMIERLWRTVKYEDVYLRDYADYFSARESLDDYFGFYNEERRHSSLGKRTPSAVYWADRKISIAHINLGCSLGITLHRRAPGIYQEQTKELPSDWI